MVLFKTRLSAEEYRLFTNRRPHHTETSQHPPPTRPHLHPPQWPNSGILGRDLQKNFLDMILPHTHPPAPLPSPTPPLPWYRCTPSPGTYHSLLWPRLGGEFQGPQRDSPSSSSSLHTTFPILTTLSLSFLPFKSFSGAQQRPQMPASFWSYRRSCLVFNQSSLSL